VVVDQVKTDRPRKIEALWHWHPECEVAVDGNRVFTQNEKGNLQVIPVGNQDWKITFIEGQEEPEIQGWYSEEYNKYEPNVASIYSTEIKADSKFVWVLFPSKKIETGIKAEILSETPKELKVKVTNKNNDEWVGRGSQKKNKVLVMAESIPVKGETTKHGKPRKVGHIKMFLIDDLQSSTIDLKVSENINADSVIDSDNSTSYINFKTLVKEHRPKVIPKKEVGKMLPWVHIAISNAKRMFLDVFHDIKPEYQQSYLNEFCYKFNRRYFGERRFDRLMVAAVSYKNEFRYNIK
jgi:hypothetical protein